jgi:hypothetical protein
MRTVFFLSLFLTAAPLAHTAFAEGQTATEGRLGMKHISVSPSPASEEGKLGASSPAQEMEKKDESSAPEKSSETAPSPAPVYEPLPIEKALVKPGDLKTWKHLPFIAAATTAEDVMKAVSLVESDRGAVPPQGLLLLAKALADQGRMEEAALYFFTGQLRASFDIARWPPRASKEDAKKLIAESKKTQDQTGQQPRPAEIKINNPHAFLSPLSGTVSAQVSAWTMKNPKRLDQIMTKVREWDESAPYAYAPGYDLPEPLAFASWQKILPAVRESFFLQMNQISSGLKQVKK